MAAVSHGERRIRRHFVHVDGRAVHYRRVGQGPALVMLPAAPLSGASLASRMQTLADRWTVIALDTPGYGRSAALPVMQPSVDDYADALEQTLRALGLGRVVLYGRHAGACIAVALAVRAPDRVVAIWCDGYPVTGDVGPAAAHGGAVATVAPAWDGSHLTWHWYRQREEFIHWPGPDGEDDGRADTDLPAPDELHRGTLDRLTATPCHTAAAAAVGRIDARAILARVSCPVLFAARPGDAFYRAVRALPALPAYMQVVAVPRDAAAAATMARDSLERFTSGLTQAPPPPACGAGPGYLDGPYGELAIECGGAGDGPPWLLLPPAPGASVLLDGEGERHRPPGPWVSVDLPGHGDSAPASDELHRLAAYAEAIEWVCHELALSGPMIHGSGTGAAVALELALRRRVCPRLLTLDDLPLLEDDEREDWLARLALDLAPTPEGAHLLRAWHQLRDLALWTPARAGRRGAIRHEGPSVAAQALQRRVLPVLQHPESHAAGWQALLAENLLWRLDVLSIPTLGVSRPDASLGRLDAAVADRPAAGGRMLQQAAGVSPLASTTAAASAWVTL